MSDSKPLARVVADVGGTNARFAWQAAAGAPLEAVTVLPVNGFARLQDALRHYLDTQAPGPVDQVAVAIASPLSGDAVRMTNHDWAFSQRAMKAEFGLRHLRVLNDFTALALALPVLPPEHRRQVGGTHAAPDAAIGLLGAGTGLGVSGLLPDGRGGWVAIAGEGGHVTLPAQDDRETTVVAGLTKLHGHASAERVCSGDGLLDVFRVLCAAEGVAVNGIDTAAGLVEAALGHAQPQAVASLEVFCAFLGAVAGNLALTLGARGGVYVGGGIVPRLGPVFDRSAFRARFETKGRYVAYLRPIPVWVITAPDSPALLGAARSLDGLD